MDVLPLAVVGVERNALRVIEHDPAGIGNVHPQIHGRLVDPENRRPRLAGKRALHSTRESSAGKFTIPQVGDRLFSEEVGRIDHRVLRRLANPGLHFPDCEVQHKPGRQPDDEEVTEKEPDRDVHWGSLRML